MHPVILIAFFVSGLASLVLETVWTRQLVVVFGATTLAVSTVLACFMAGLALGAWVFGRIADRLKRPVVVYAALEAGVGLWALLLPLVIGRVYPLVNAWLWRTFEPGFWAFSILRFSAVALILLPPTTLMGATLPLLSRHVVRTGPGSAWTGRRVGWLYTINTTGAVAGAFLATFVLLPALGVSLTNTLAASADLLLALVVWTSRRRLEPGCDDPEAQEWAALHALFEADRVATFVPRPVERAAALAAFGLSGFAAMNLQVILNRGMALVLGSSIYAFGVVLIAFLIGIAAGSAAASAWAPRVRRPVLALALVQLGAALAIMALHLYLDRLTFAFGHLILALAPDYWRHIGRVEGCMALVAVLAALPPTLFLGATFPLAVKVASRGTDRVGRDVGALYAVNTVGAILGSFASAFVLVPLFSRWGHGRGLELALLVSAILHGLAAVLLALAATGPRPGRWALAAGVALAVALFARCAPPWNQTTLTLGIFRMSSLKSAMNAEIWGRPEIPFYFDGVSTTVSVERWGRQLALKNNGKVEASNGGDMSTQIMVSASPLLLHERAGAGLDAAIIGFGSGVTVGAALQFPVRRVDVIEYEPAVVLASRLFGRSEGERPEPDRDVNHLVYRPAADPAGLGGDPGSLVLEPRLRVIDNDGRNFLASTPARYDVIVSEPSNPWITGVSNLFTLEHFTRARQALRPGGVFSQWVQLYELSPRMVKVILKTFAQAFPHMTAFAAKDRSSDIILLGSDRPIPLDIGRMEAAMDDPRVRAELGRADVSGPSDVLSRLLFANRDEVMAYVGDAAVNTDDNLLVEFTAPEDLIGSQNFEGYLDDIYTPQWSYGRLTETTLQGLGDGQAAADRLARLSLSLFGHGREDEGKRFVRMALDRGAADGDRLRRIADLFLDDTHDPPPGVELPIPGPRLPPALHDLEDQALASALEAARQGHPSEVLAALRPLPEFLRRLCGPELTLLRGYGLAEAPAEDGGDCVDAIALLNELVRFEPLFTARQPEVFLYLGRCHDRLGHFDKALKSMQAYADAVMAMETPK